MEKQKIWSEVWYHLSELIHILLIDRPLTLQSPEGSSSDKTWSNWLYEYNLAAKHTVPAELTNQHELEGSASIYTHTHTHTHICSVCFTCTRKEKHSSKFPLSCTHTNPSNRGVHLRLVKVPFVSCSWSGCVTPPLIATGAKFSRGDMSPFDQKHWI